MIQNSWGRYWIEFTCGLIPKLLENDGILSVVKQISSKPQFICKHFYFSIDKYEYCYDTAVLFNQERGWYETSEVDM